MRTLLRENLRPQRLKRSSSEGPRRSITMMLYSPWFELKRTFRSAVVDVGNAFVDHGGFLQEVLIELALVEELRVLSIDGL